MVVYINFPNPHLTIHHDHTCREPYKNQKRGQRTIQVVPQNLLDVLDDLIDGTLKLGQSPQYRDLYLNIKLDTIPHEEMYVRVVHSILSQKFPKFTIAPIIPHC